MREDADICDFTAGELSPKLKGRTDFEGYFDGCETLLNMVALPQGGATRRPGTGLGGLAKSQADTTFATRMVPFVFSTVQAYALEFSNTNVRVYMNDGVVLSGGLPVDIAVPYTTADLPGLSFAQSADTLFICHQNYPPATLTRSSHTSWTYAAIVFQDGPYLPINTTDTTITPSGTSGNITLTASSIVGINPTSTSSGQGFLPGDVGRIMRIQLFSLWAWVKITGYTSPTVVSATVQAAVNNGAYSAIDGAQWVTNTEYPTGAVVKNTTDDGDGSATRYYQALTGGRSGGPNGPSGKSNNIIDGSVTWSEASPLHSNEWETGTQYVPGDVVHVAATGNYYVCTQGGGSGSGAAPAGTGTGIKTNHAVWEYVSEFPFPTATKFWQMGKWGGANGYPSVVTFWQQRLALLGSVNQPSAVECSNTADFTNFSPSDAQGTVLATSGLSWVISDAQVDAVRWAIAAGSSVSMQMGIGTSSGEHVIQPATNSLALSPTNVQVYPETNIGSAANLSAIRVGKSVLFVNKSGRKLFEWVWQWAINGYQAIERTTEAEHITRPVPSTLQGIVSMAYQRQPYGVLWCVLGDGQLIGMTYLPDEKIIAWHRHRLGGQYYGGHPIVESLCTIPSPDGSYDEVWMSVLRTVNGVVTRTVEFLSRFFDGQAQESAVCLDSSLSSGLTYPAATLTPAAITGTGIAFNASAGVFSGASVGRVIRVNDGVAVVRTYVNSVKVLGDYMRDATSTKPVTANNWSCTAPATSFSGLDHLNGETVGIYGDGADCGTAAVAGGSVTLPGGGSASYATIGLPSTFDLVTMPWAPKRALPLSPTGKTKKIDHLYLRIHESLGFQFGRKLTDPLTNEVSHKLETFNARYTSAVVGWAPPLFTGIARLPVQGGGDYEGQIEITGSGPFPCTVLAIAASADVGTE